MDTRKKIVGLENLQTLFQNDAMTVIAGLFDPLTLIQAQRIAAIARGGHKILAVVIPDSNTLLTTEARAALVADLRVVSAVVIADPDELKGLGIAVADDRAAERERSAEFVSFVLRRHKQAEVPA